VLLCARTIHRFVAAIVLLCVRLHILSKNNAKMKEDTSVTKDTMFILLERRSAHACDRAMFLEKISEPVCKKRACV
jgi:hypothetical protein